MGSAYRTYVSDIKVRGHFGDLAIDGRIILRGLQRQMKWIYVAEARVHLLSAFEPSGCVNR
jgi:hypothetical protein